MSLMYSKKSIGPRNEPCDVGLYQKIWQNLGGLHKFVFYYPMPSSSHGLSHVVLLCLHMYVELRPRLKL